MPSVVLRRCCRLLTILSLAFALPPAARAAVTLVDTEKSPSAVLRPVGLDEVRWTDGFWADRVRVCRKVSIPKMWEHMKSGKHKPFLEHFLIAAGKAEGGHHGAKWNDGELYKWMEAALATLAVDPNPELAANVDEAIQAITQAQREDGYIHTPVLIANRNGDQNVKPLQDRNAFEMYNMGHLLTTACLHYRLTGERSLLDVAEKAAAFMMDTFKEPTPELARNSVCPSHYMGTVELYRTTGDERYLKLVKTFFDMRSMVQDKGDDNQDRVPFAEQREALGHAVRANYLYAGAADFYMENNDHVLLGTLRPVWENMVHKKMYITGACGALYDGASPDGSPDQGVIRRVHQSYGRNYQLPNTTAHNESCANIANLMWSWRMFQITGDGRYVDVLEQALYNSILAGISLGGNEYFYVNPLRVVDPLPTNLRYPRTRQEFYTSFCCPPNLVRTVAEVNSYVYSKSDDTLWVNLYGANDLATTLKGEPLKLSQQTDYPWDGAVTLRVDECPAAEFALKLRRPAWAESVNVKLNGEPLSELTPENGYFKILRQWKPGDTVTLDMPMPTRLMEAHPLVEEASNQVAVQRGPIVYCLESPDLPKGIDLEAVAVPSGIVFDKHYESDLLQGIVVLEGRAVARKSEPWGDMLYRPAKSTTGDSFDLRLIPYYAWANRGEVEMSVWLPLVP